MNNQDVTPKSFLWERRGPVGLIRLNRPARKNPLTFESYTELRDLFQALGHSTDVKAVVFASQGGNFCSGGDVHDIIGPLLDQDMKELLAFTRLTGDLIRAMTHCGIPIIAAAEGVSVGAGAMIALACDIRFAAPDCRTAFLFTRVGLGGCDMGACAMLPRVIGRSRAADLLYTGRVMTAEEGENWGYFKTVVPPDQLLDTALDYATRLATGPTFAHRMTKTMLEQEATMPLDMALEAEAQAQAICMKTEDFRRAYEAFIAGDIPVFKGD